MQIQKNTLPRSLDMIIIRNKEERQKNETNINAEITTINYYYFLFLRQTDRQ